jgi:hypothetical protein
MITTALQAGIIPNDVSKATHNSQALKRHRSNNLVTNWPHVNGVGGACIYYLADSVQFSPGECWYGQTPYTQLYFTQPQGPLITLSNWSKIESLGIINYAAFSNGQKRLLVGITDGPLHGLINGKRWSISNVIVSWCEHAIQLNNTWIGSIQDCFLSNNHNGLHVPVGAQALAVNCIGGEFGGNSTGYGILIEGIIVDCAFRSVTIEANALGGVLHTGINGKTNTVYKSCYFESNGFYGDNGAQAKKQARHFVVDSPNDVSTRLLYCGFHDPDVPSYASLQGRGFEAVGNWHPNKTINAKIVSRGAKWTPGYSGVLQCNYEELEA